MTREEFIKECEDLSQEYFELAKKHNYSVWGQAFYMGVSNTFIQVANSLSGDRSPKPTPKEKLLSAIFDRPQNFLNVNVAATQFYGSEEKMIEFEATQDSELIKQFLAWCEKTGKTPDVSGVNAYIYDQYYATDPVVDDDEDDDIDDI